ncbi:MAG: FtsX-like permease family protein [bacterium]|nr:FtsX-like permease family protein [bacterium]
MKRNRMIKNSFHTMARHKVRTFFMMLGIIVGITALTMIVSFGQGAKKEVMGKINKLFSANNIFISGRRVQLKGGRHAASNTQNFTIADMEALQDEIPNIELWDPMQVMADREVKHREKNVNVRIYGHSPKAEIVWNRSVVSGEFFDDADMNKSARVALIGEITAKELFGAEDPIGREIRIGTVPFRVKGVLQSIGVDPHGNNRDNEVHVPITTAMRRLMNVDYITGAKVQVRDAHKTQETAARITQVLRERHQLAPEASNDFYLMTPVMVRRMVAKANSVFDLLLPLIAGISLLAGGVVVANLMLVAVNERTAEIGLRKAVGARSKDILRQFLMETTVITGIGGIIGIILGTLGVLIIASMMGIPSAFSFGATLFGVIFSSLVGLVAGVFPARRAASFDPVETLR